MATRPKRFWQAPQGDGTAWIEYDWDDTDGTMRVVRWINQTASAVHFDLTNVNTSGTPTGRTYSDTIAAGTAQASRNITGAARNWGITVDSRGRPSGVDVNVSWPYSES